MARQPDGAASQVKDQEGSLPIVNVMLTMPDELARLDARAAVVKTEGGIRKAPTSPKSKENSPKHNSDDTKRDMEVELED